MDFSRLATIRLDKDLSQREAAKLLKVSKSTYARWETMEEMIPLKHLIDYCNYFKVSMNYVCKLSNKNYYDKYDYSNELNKLVVGKNILNLRKRFNLSQQELASLLNTSQSTISAYENGKTLILTIFIFEIAKKFNLEIDEICGLKKEQIHVL